MTHKKNNSKNTGKTNAYEAVNLFSEWPAQADIVKDFGGDPKEVYQTQWKMKKDTPEAK